MQHLATTVHDSLVAALVKANLTGALSDDGPFTVFAPIDTAFSDAGVNLDDFDTDEEITALTGILTYHVVSGTVMSTDLTDSNEDSQPKNISDNQDSNNKE